MKYNFKNVPSEYRPIPFWSWNEKLDTSETVEQINKMNDAGIGGFLMHARGGLQTEYMGDEWFENVDASADEAAKLGMHAWAYDENGWPSGFGSGIVNGRGLKYQQKYLRCEKFESDGENTIVVKDGYRFYFDINPYYVDTLDGEVTEVFIAEIYEKYVESFSGRIDGFFTDEPQISRNGIPWSLIMPREYKARYGENLLDVLVELFEAVGNYKTTRVKFWKMVTELFSQNFMKKIYDWCRAHGFKLTGHMVLEENLHCQLVTNGAVMPHYEYFDIPGMDWLGRSNTPSLTPYEVGSAARQTGKKQVLSETFACCGHNVGHDELKWILEYQMVRGITLLCQHLEGYSNRGIRKRDYPPAMYIQQPWWKDYRMFNDAMSRTGMMLTGGDDGVDVLLIHPETTAWALFDNRDRTAIDALNARLMATIKTLEEKHINFHLGDEILIERHGRVDGDRFVIGEKSYSKVILLSDTILLENTERLLAEYKSSGGVMCDVESLEASDIIDVPEITYCERRHENYTVYFFVNSTTNTYTANIAKGAWVVDPVTGELYPFDGTHEFKRYESLIVIDDGTSRQTACPKKSLKAVDLSGEWTLEASTENSLTLDKCDYYFDGVLEEKNGYVLNAMYRAIERMKKTHITCEYKIKVDCVPNSIYLCCEQPWLFDIKVNGETVDKTDCGYFRDKSFRKLDIAKYIKLGENKIVLDTDFEQSEATYAAIERSKKFESERNKLTFDAELEQVYLVGDFSVRCDAPFEDIAKDAEWYRGEFVIDAPKTSVTLDKIERQGFIGFAGEMTLSMKFVAEDKDYMLDFVKCGVNVVKAELNGKPVGSFMWEPYTADLSDLIEVGENTLKLTLVGNLRNMQGPFHLASGEQYGVGPSSFYKEHCVWYRGPVDGRWDDDYCFVNVSVKNREQ